MSDFLTEDIDELLQEKEVEKLSGDEKAYQALLKHDKELILGFADKRRRLRWPEPVRKRYTR